MFTSYIDDDKENLLLERWKKDIVWSIANGIPETNEKILPVLGSWTSFNRNVSTHDQAKSLIKYMPVINQPPKYDVCKYYLDHLNEIINDLGLDYMFAHADEEVYARLAHIIWKHGDIYKKIFILIVGFHQLRVRQKLIYKQYGCVGYKEWFVDAGIIAPGSVDKAFSGYHYYHCMRLLKESFDALVQYKTDQLTNNYETMDDILLQNLKTLQKEPSPEAVENIISSLPFQILYQQIVNVEGD